MLEYNPNTGMFRHVPPCGNNARRDWHPGSSESSRYYSVFFNGKNMRAHRVAYYLMTGDWPDTIDHIDGNPKNNVWSNLRSVDTRTNNRNLHRARAHNSTGTLGVTKFRNKFRARITVNGVGIHLGVFNSEAAAQAAYTEAKQTYHY